MRLRCDVQGGGLVVGSLRALPCNCSIGHESRHCQHITPAAMLLLSYRVTVYIHTPPPPPSCPSPPYTITSSAGHPTFLPSYFLSVHLPPILSPPQLDTLLSCFPTVLLKCPPPPYTITSSDGPRRLACALQARFSVSLGAVAIHPKEGSNSRMRRPHTSGRRNHGSCPSDFALRSSA